jgi:hypothetical protein
MWRLGRTEAFVQTARRFLDSVGPATIFELHPSRGGARATIHSELDLRIKRGERLFVGAKEVKP